MSDSSIFDDFDEPSRMRKTFCQQVSSQEYSDNVATETDKALGELCLLLDKKPELYARVLRKRKREEIENDGVLSFMKSKVLGLVQGDEYTDSLLCDMECLKKTNALKAGMCRTFQYAQEIKDEPVRQSKRQASKIASQRMEKVRSNKKKLAENISTNKSSSEVQKISNNDCGDGQQIKHVDGSKESSKVSDNNKEARFEEITLSSDEDDTTSHNDIPPENIIVSSEKPENDTKVESQDFVPPPPGPPPPLPPLLLPPTSIRQHLTPTVQKLTDNFLTPTQPDALQTISDSSLNSSSTSRTSSSGRRHGVNGISPRQSKSDGTLSNFTPDNMGRKLRSQKHGGSSTPLSSIHSELIASNPISRLRATSVIRSPGGTPVRPANVSRLPSEPLHKALVTAVRSKFKNVNTPSPRSANNSGNFNFSP